MGFRIVLIDECLIIGNNIFEDYGCLLIEVEFATGLTNEQCYALEGTINYYLRTINLKTVKMDWLNLNIIQMECSIYYILLILMILWDII